MTPEIGDLVKVKLPGESPWAECVKTLPDGRWVGRICNDLVANDPEKLRALNNAIFGIDEALPKQHDYSRDDLLVFSVHRQDFEGETYTWWSPEVGSVKQ